MEEAFEKCQNVSKSKIASEFKELLESEHQKCIDNSEEEQLKTIIERLSEILEQKTKEIQYDEEG